MIEFAPALAVFFKIATLAALFIAYSYWRERNEHRATIEILENRVTVLKGDNIALEAANKLKGQTITELTQQREDLKRQIGRMEAERRAAQPKGGRFVKKPKPVARD